MTNPTRKLKAAPAPAAQQADYVGQHAGAELMEQNSALQALQDYVVPPWLQQMLDDGFSEANESTTTSTSVVAEQNKGVVDEEDNYDDEEDEANSCSSFSLQECINEFRARRMRRISTHSREAPEECSIAVAPKGKSHNVNSADADLINQNRTNKEHERKCKPCENGFCYCFTSDSGDGSCVARRAARGAHVRQPKRNRKSENNQVSCALPLHHSVKTNEKRRQSAPDNFKILQNQQQTQKKEPQPRAMKTATATAANGPNLLTAISRLETTTTHDAPLIHIIQELHNNCVISEVRVNKHKMEAHQRCRSLAANPQTKTTLSSPKKSQIKANSPKKHSIEPPLTSTLLTYPQDKNPAPSAPALEEISESETSTEDLVYTSPLEISSKSNESSRRKHKAAGRLLEKRLSYAHKQVKPRNWSEPPPKPPRLSNIYEDKSSVSTIVSSSPSIREAERVLDDFLRKRGVQLPVQGPPLEQNKSSRKPATMCREALKREKRKSYPLTQMESKLNTRHTLPSCPSLSDIERVTDSHRKRSSKRKEKLQLASEKPAKELSIGWTEPKISDMLNYDKNANRREFKSQAAQAEPQVIGWQAPHKIDLDTVDGGLRRNLASNIESKDTPVKTRLFSSAQKPKGSSSSTQKFIWGEQWRNLSPWMPKQNSNRANGQKSNLKSSSRAFLTNSKKKILRLVSPKKDNQVRRRNADQGTLQRTIGIQTSTQDLRSYELSSTPQSPPGSYHSAVQTSQKSSTTSQSQNATPAATNFDFTRTVQSPPKKAPRSSQRKLTFPLSCAGGGDTSVANDRRYAGVDQDVLPGTLTKTYRSYHSDLDQDVTISKMGYILNNIRAKLEASDAHAVRTFQEIELREVQAESFDCPDGHVLPRPSGGGEVPRNARRIEAEYEEPIYSEIEEDSIHISGSPQIDNKTGIQHFPSDRNPEVLYAKVNKTPKPQMVQTPVALGKFLHNSLSTTTSSMSAQFTPSPPLPSVDSNYAVSGSTQTGTTVVVVANNPPLVHYQSLNNIRVMEHNSPPKQHRNLSKSDLSLQRSEIFLENLYRSEIILESGEPERLEKVENNTLQQSYSSHQYPGTGFIDSSPPLNDSYASYVSPIDGDIDSNTAGSQLGLDCIELPHQLNQSTPKKNQRQHLYQQHPPQTFTTKFGLGVKPHPELNLDLEDVGRGHTAFQRQNESVSCPTTPRKLFSIPDVAPEKPHASSLYEVDVNQKKIASAPPTTRYNRLKNALRKSLRKGKFFAKADSRRSPTAQLEDRRKQTDLHNESVSSCNSFNLDTLFAQDEEAPLSAQIAKAVNICRQLPDLEVSPEMVEAERLLLFSALWTQRDKPQLSLVTMHGLMHQQQQHKRRFFIDTMRLPVKADANRDLFFNYFYIGIFECGGTVRSTQSVECHEREAIFRDCGIEFTCDDEAGDDTQAEVKVHCNIFMLRLRKISTLSLEPRKPIKLANISPTSSTSSSSDGIVSRFRLHASFSVKASDFRPYEYVECASKNTDNLCLRAANSCRIPLTPHTRSTNLGTEIVLSGRAEARFPKRTHSGFLNVQDPHNQHNWNRRWCTLDGLYVRVWHDVNDIQAQALLCLDLRQNVQTTPLTEATRELCARARSFCLQCAVTKAEEQVATAAVFFVAETQADLSAWLEQLNAVLSFVAQWM